MNFKKEEKKIKRVVIASFCVVMIFASAFLFQDILGHEVNIARKKSVNEEEILEKGIPKYPTKEEWEKEWESLYKEKREIEKEPRTKNQEPRTKNQEPRILYR